MAELYFIILLGLEDTTQFSAGAEDCKSIAGVLDYSTWLKIDTGYH